MSRYTTELMASGSPAARMLAIERLRQMDVEGWDEIHDDRHTNNELYRAAACYGLASEGHFPDRPPPAWPWSSSGWKPGGGRTRNIVKMGALLLAERDRLDRIIERTVDQLDQELLRSTNGG